MSCCHLMSPITKVTGFVNFKVIVIYRGLSFLIRGAPRAIKMGDFGKQGDWNRGPLCTPGPRPAPSSGRFGGTRFAKDAGRHFRAGGPRMHCTDLIPHFSVDKTEVQELKIFDSKSVS